MGCEMFDAAMVLARAGVADRGPGIATDRRVLIFKRVYGDLDPAIIAKIVTEEFPKVPGLVRTTTLTAFKAYSKADLEQAWDIGVE